MPQQSSRRAGCPVLSLQERVRALEMHFPNGTLMAADDTSSFSLLQSEHPRARVAGSALQLQGLQSQLTQVRTSQEHLQQWVANVSRNPG